MTEAEISSFVMANGDAIAKKHLNHTGPVTLQSRFKLAYGGAADWAVFDIKTNKIIGLIECKGEISLTEFVRGLGQVEQYYYAIKRSFSNPPSDFSSDAKVLYVVDKATLKKIKHWDLMHFTKADNLVVVDGEAIASKALPTEEYALYKEKDIGKLISVSADQLILTNIPFARDIYLFEVYMGLMELYEKSKNVVVGNRISSVEKTMENLLAKYGTTSSGNARNVGIFIKYLGVIDEYNIPNAYGMKLLRCKYVDFVKMIIFHHYNTTIVIIINAILNIAASKGEDLKKIKVTSQEIKNEILRMYNNKKLKNLTDDSLKKKNAIETCLRIMERELGAVSTTGGRGTGKEYTFNYLPLKEVALAVDMDNEIYTRIPNELKKYMSDLGYTNWEK